MSKTVIEENVLSSISWSDIPRRSVRTKEKCRTDMETSKKWSCLTAYACLWSRSSPLTLTQTCRIHGRRDTRVRSSSYEWSTLSLFFVRSQCDLLRRCKFDLMHRWLSTRTRIKKRRDPDPARKRVRCPIKRNLSWYLDKARNMQASAEGDYMKLRDCNCEHIYLQTTTYLYSICISKYRPTPHARKGTLFCIGEFHSRAWHQQLHHQHYNSLRYEHISFEELHQCSITSCCHVHDRI